MMEGIAVAISLAAFSLVVNIGVGLVLIVRAINQLTDAIERAAKDPEGKRG